MKRICLFCFVFLFLALCLADSYAQCPVPPPWYPPEPPQMKDKEPLPPPPEYDSVDLPAFHGSGEITGKVVPRDSSGNADESRGIAGAVIKVYDGSSFKTCISGANGQFSIRGISPGEKLISISVPGYRDTTGQVQVVENASRNVLISLSPLWYMKKKECGYINVYAYGKEDYNGKWIGVESIRVREIGNYSNRWYNCWNGSYSSSYQSLYCSQAPMDRYYHIEVVWNDGSVRTREIRLTEKYRDVSIYPW